VIAACGETSLVGLRDRAVMRLLVWAQAESPSDDMRDSGFTLGIKARRSHCLTTTSCFDRPDSRHGSDRMRTIASTAY
jgi:hypothetical protein